MIAAGFHWCTLVLGALAAVASSLVLREEALTTTPPAHPPVPTASWPALPANFSDLPSDAVTCWNSHFSFSFTTYWLWTEASKTFSPIYTTYTPPITHNRTYTATFETDCSTTTYGLTTLCDGIPRAESRSSKCQTTSFLTSDVWTQSSSVTSYSSATWTSSFQPVQPTCKPAPDGSPLCTRLYDAYSYRSSQLKSDSALDARYLGTLYNMIGPRCISRTAVSTTFTDTLCRMFATSYSAYYWPTPAPSGSDYCESSRPTPTLTGAPKTTVISGHTLTSPSVYHFLRDVRVDSYLFNDRRWNVSVTVPPDDVLTVAQHETDVLSAVSLTCRGIEMDYCSVQFTPDFRIQDLSTVRKSAYDRDCTYYSCDKNVIYQTNYRPDIAVPISEIVKQNTRLGGEDCTWDLVQGPEGGWISYITSSTPAVMWTDLETKAFISIPTATRESIVTGAPGALPGGSMVKATPTPTSTA